MEHIKYKNFTLEMVNASADRFETVWAWRKNDYPSFISAKYRGWLLAVLKRKGWDNPHDFEKLLLTTKQRLNEQIVETDAKKYTSRADWAKLSPSIYHYAWRNDLIEKYTSHMDKRRKRNYEETNQ